MHIPNYRLTNRARQPIFCTQEVLWESMALLTYPMTRTSCYVTLLTLNPILSRNPSSLLAAIFLFKFGKETFSYVIHMQVYLHCDTMQYDHRWPLYYFFHLWSRNISTEFNHWYKDIDRCLFTLICFAIIYF